MKTINGIYYNLDESEYKLILSELNMIFIFSSIKNKERFEFAYNTFLTCENDKLKSKYNIKLQLNELLLIKLYRRIEKRGFKILFNNKDISESSLFKIEIIN